MVTFREAVQPLGVTWCKHSRQVWNGSLANMDQPIGRCGARGFHETVRQHPGSVRGGSAAEGRPAMGRHNVNAFTESTIHKSKTRCSDESTPTASSLGSESMARKALPGIASKHCTSLAHEGLAAYRIGNAVDARISETIGGTRVSTTTPLFCVTVSTTAAQQSRATG